MKKVLIFLFVLGCSAHLFSKDLIVTQGGDSLKCKILNTEDNYVYYTHIVKGQLKDDKLNINDVKYLERNYYKTVKLSKTQIDSIYKPSRWRIGVQCGYSRLIEKDDNTSSGLDLSSFEDDLKNGFNYSIDVTYYFDKTWGAGIKYHGFTSSNTLDDFSYTSTDGTVYSGTISDKPFIQYIGPYISCRYILPSDKRNVFYANFGVAYAWYSEKATLFSSDYTATGNTFSPFLNAGYEYSISKNIALGVELGYNIGSLSKFTLDDGTSSQTVSVSGSDKISLSTFDAALGIRYNIR